LRLRLPGPNLFRIHKHSRVAGGLCHVRPACRLRRNLGDRFVELFLEKCSNRGSGGGHAVAACSGSAFLSNLALGARRAESVRGYLVERGVSAGRIDTISYGKERPIAAGSNEEAWARNRNAHTAIVELRDQKKDGGGYFGSDWLEFRLSW
jgi:hypothetical protein